MDVSELVANYVAAWNEPDPDMRRAGSARYGRRTEPPVIGCLTRTAMTQLKPASWDRGINGCARGIASSGQKARSGIIKL